VNFTLTASNGGQVLKVALRIESNKKTIEKVMNFTNNGNMIGFAYTFNEDGEFPLTITLNDKEVIQYLLVVE
jgi:hypothetical protein